MGIDFRLLGEVAAYLDGRPLDLGHRRQRGVLAVLVVDANRPVTSDALIDRVWADRPPRHARTALSGYVSRLRKILAADLRIRLDRHPGGYQLTLDAETVDLHRFSGLVARATASTAADTDDSPADLLDEALELWHGPALGDLDTPWAREARAVLEAARYAAERDRCDIALDEGQHEALLGGLSATAEAHPLDERLAGQLMLALYRSRRQADALRHYARVRSALADELGVDPGPELQALHGKILSAAPELAWSAAGGGRTPVPQQLPAAPRRFSGRQGELAWLDRALSEQSRAGAGTTVSVVTGTAGVGKSALALAWASRVRGQFGDGQLYADLRGYAASPAVDAFEAVAGFLRALGVASHRIPSTLAEASALYRTLLAGKRMLVVLDDARSAEQIRPLIPGSPDSCVLVTSRESLSGLVARDGAGQLRLDVLSKDEAVDLQSAILGPARVAAEREAATALAELCARLPLAIGIAAARLLADPSRTLASEVAELQSDRRLDLLRIPEDEDTAVRIVFERSYAALDAQARRLFRLLGLIPLVDATAPTAAVLLDAPIEVAAGLLDRLAAAHLLGVPQPGRFAFHDLLRLYARERAQLEEAPAELAAGAGRLLLAYHRTADAADRILHPERIRLPLGEEGGAPLLVLTDPAGSLDWFDAERANLMVALRFASEHGPPSSVWGLAHSLRGYHQLRMHVGDWRTAGTLALAAAAEGADDRGLVAAQLSFARLHERLGEFPQAEQQSTRALALSRRCGWLEAEAAALSDLGSLSRLTGRPDDAETYSSQALDVARRTGNPMLIASRLINKGNLHAEAGRLAQARNLYLEVLPIFRSNRSRSGEATALACLGECALLLGDLPAAVEHFTEASQLNRTLGNRGLAADNLRSLAVTHAETGRLAEAVGLAETALSESRQTGDRRYEADCLNALATAQRRLGDPRQAAESHRLALDLSREINASRHEVAALIGLAQCGLVLGHPGPAVDHAEQAVALAQRGGFRLLAGPALAALGQSRLALGNRQEAIDAVDQALVVLRGTGQRLGEARALMVLGMAAEVGGDLSAALGHWRTALDLFLEIGAPETEDVRSTIAHAVDASPR